MRAHYVIINDKKKHILAWEYRDRLDRDDYARRRIRVHTARALP